MQDTPDAPTLLTEIAQFLESQVRPSIDDKGLAFRVRIAVHLLGVIAREVEHAPAHLNAEADRLSALLGGAPPGDDLHAWVEGRNAALAKGLRADAYDAETRTAIRTHLMQTLRETLAIAQPRFDTRP